MTGQIFQDGAILRERPFVLDVLRLQLVAQEDMLKLQRQNVELQRALLDCMLGAPSEPDILQDSKESNPCESSSEVAGPPDFMPDGNEQAANEPDVSLLGHPDVDLADLRGHEECSRVTDAVPHHTPWHTGPSESTWLRAGLFEWLKHPFEILFAYDFNPNFVNAGLEALSPARSNIFLQRSLEQILLFLALAVSLLVPSCLEMKTPSTGLQLALNILLAASCLLALVGIIHGMLLYKLCSMVSDNNFGAWLAANRKAVMFVNVLTGCLTWLLAAIVFVNFYDKNLQVDWKVGWVFAQWSIPVLFAFVFPSFSLCQVAARSAVFSGSLADAKIPVPSSGLGGITSAFFGAALGGQRLGFQAMTQYYAAARKLAEETCDEHNRKLAEGTLDEHNRPSNILSI